jgi:protein-L-isoaspartate(D-aspartate) O-methyltransferase
MVDLIRAKDRMIDAQLRRRGITDERVLEAMARVPRERFVAPGFEEFSYEDSPLAIGEGQTISQPYIVALMLQEAAIEPDDIVLEVGTGSGYAAAVMGRLAGHVYTIERHQSLAETARQRLAAGGHDNVEVKIGDGTKGWPDVGPFSAILVAAGGTSIPVPLTEQLDIGGRLIIPVGERDSQRLIKVTRTSAKTFQEEDLGGVIFVPLVSDADAGTDRRTQTDRMRPLTEIVARDAEPLPDLDDPAFGAMFDRFGEKRVVLLGESTHGTSEFYRARAAITRRLVEKHGFAIVAVEADWPDAAMVDRYVRQRPPPDQTTATAPFQRFPTWMWRNDEFAGFIEWMKDHNGARPGSDRVGFYGLDLYNLGASITTVLAYLDRTDPESAKVARERYGCLTPWQSDPSTYGRAVITARFEGCEDAVVTQCRDLLSKSIDRATADGDDYLDASQSARLIAAAERYYRIMYYGGPAAWNLRDDHMFDTLANLLEAKGPGSRAVVWAHNSHIGDARATDMSIMRDEINLGQRCRERFGDEAALIGFGTGSGKVAAATDWDGGMEVKQIRPGMENSFEKLFHDAGIERHLIDFQRNPDLKKRLSIPMLERFIGVIYRPETERASHYVNAAIARQFDAFVWFDRTTPVSPLGREGGQRNPSDTYPFGL